MPRRLSLIFLLVVLVLAPIAAHAQQTTNPCTIAGLKANQNNPSTLPKCVNQIYIWSLGIGALLALLMTILGGYSYMTAAGNAERADSGKSYIWGSVIGLVLLFTAYLLLQTINPDLINFNIDALKKSGTQIQNPTGTPTRN
jgi:hypothetical protein